MIAKRKPLDWLLDTGLRDAQYWEAHENGKVRCHLCPRNCYVRPGNFGFCKARYNDNGVLKTSIWGKLLVPSIEPIETEAVYHYWPGKKILSIGNLGCNLRCDFCQNWESSDLLNLNSNHVTYRTPEQIVKLAQDLDIEIISFTYNDPVIWFEFVRETAQLARDNGIKTLLKSASYISGNVAEELTKYIDVFSISLKTINPDTFRQISQGKLQPVLDSLKIYHQSGKHLEVSNLVVTGLTDVEEEIRKLSQWIRDELADNVPMHFVRFHPAYHYRHVERTPIAFLERSKQIALEEGLKYVYIGNTYGRGHADSHCSNCGSRVVERFGLSTRMEGLTLDGRCVHCGHPQEIQLNQSSSSSKTTQSIVSPKCAIWDWRNADTRNIHLRVKNNAPYNTTLYCRHIEAVGTEINYEAVNIPARTQIRISVGQVDESERTAQMIFEGTTECQIVELQDRAHFPLEAAV